MRPVAAVIPAAGGSSRLRGLPKQLLPWAGEPLLARVTRQALAARVDPVIVVLGRGAPVIRRVLSPLEVAGRGRLRWAENPDYESGGLSSSIRAALPSVPRAASGLIIVLGDQPFLRARHFDDLIARFMRLSPSRGGHLIVAATAGGRQGPPVLFGRGLFADLARLRGDAGGKSIIRAAPGLVVEAGMEAGALRDIDTWEDYLRLRGCSPGRGRRLKGTAPIEAESNRDGNLSQPWKGGARWTPVP